MGNSSDFCKLLGIKYPVICGAMYPCSNPELVAAVSEAGGIGIVQPMSLTYVYGYDFRDGLKYIRSLTQKPIGLNLIIEKSSKIYQERTRQWMDIAIEENIKFFITALGNPNWVVDKAHPEGITVFHDITHRKWAEKAMDGDVDGFICVNNRAGGHAGELSPQQLIDDIAPLGKPIVCAGGVGDSSTFKEMLTQGYSGVQMGTRFIASQECSAHQDYKSAVVKAMEEDIVLTEKISGVPVSVINTPYIRSIGTKANFLSRWLLKGRKTKHWMRMFYTMLSVWKLKHANLKGTRYRDYFQAGKSVQGVTQVKSVNSIIKNLNS